MPLIGELGEIQVKRVIGQTTNRIQFRFKQPLARGSVADGPNNTVTSHLAIIQSNPHHHPSSLRCGTVRPRPK